MSLFSKLFGVKVKTQICEADLTPIRSENANQIKPRRSYVYAHTDSDGSVFYIGKGVGRRAWAKDDKRRHYYWHRYIEINLDGDYSIEILNDNLSNDQAENIEQEWISYYGDKLINWVNMGRRDDWDANARFHKNRNANRELMAQAKKHEAVDLEKAVELYIEAIDAIPSYAHINYTSGLLGRVMQEDMDAGRGVTGEILAIDRLSLCLVKLGRAEEAKERIAKYFNAFKRDSAYSQTEKIHKRVEKAVSKISK
jgi:hypothetical protein